LHTVAPGTETITERRHGNYDGYKVLITHSVNSFCERGR